MGKVGYPNESVEIIVMEPLQIGNLLAKWVTVGGMDPSKYGITHDSSIYSSFFSSFFWTFVEKPCSCESLSAFMVQPSSVYSISPRWSVVMSLMPLLASTLALSLLTTNNWYWIECWYALDHDSTIHADFCSESYRLLYTADTYIREARFLDS